MSAAAPAAAAAAVAAPAVPAVPALPAMSAEKRLARAESRRLHALFSGSINRRTMRVKRNDRCDRKLLAAKAAGTLGKKNSSEEKETLYAAKLAAYKPRWNFIPGTILIMLAGRYRGTRVVFLRELPSKLLLVSGPLSINGVPLRRVNRAYVAKTSAKITVSDKTAALATKVQDSMFARPKKVHHSKIARKEKRDGASAFFEEKKSKKAKKVTKVFKDLQKRIDSGLVRKIGNTHHMRGYLASKFSLTKGVFPHMINF